MRKILSFGLAAILIFTLTGCGSKAAAWKESDFSLYDSDKKEIAFTTEGSPSIQLTEYDDAMTDRGVTIGDKAMVAIEKYNFSLNYAVCGVESDYEVLDSSVNLEKEIKSAARNADEFYIAVALNEKFKPVKLKISGGEVDFDNSDGTWLFCIEIYDEKVADIYIVKN